MTITTRAYCARPQSLKAALVCHGILGSRWCLLPVAALAVCGLSAATVALGLAGQFCAWPLAVLLANVSVGVSEAASRWPSAEKPAAVLRARLGAAAAILGAPVIVALVLWNTPVVGPWLVALLAVGSILATAASCRSEPRRRIPLLYSAWAACETLVSVSTGLALQLALGMLLAGQHGAIDRSWVWLYRLGIANHVLCWAGALVQVWALLCLWRGLARSPTPTGLPPSQSQPDLSAELRSVSSHSVEPVLPSSTAEVTLEDGLASPQVEGFASSRSCLKGGSANASMSTLAPGSTRGSFTGSFAASALGSFASSIWTFDEVNRSPSGAAGAAEASPSAKHSPACSRWRKLWLGSAVVSAVGLLLYAVALSASMAESLSSMLGTKPGLANAVAAPAPPCQGCYCAPRFREDDIEVTRDVVFSKAVNLSSSERWLRLDVHRGNPLRHRGNATDRRPAHRAPAIVMLHGGGFWRGGRGDQLVAEEANYLARLGYVVFNIEYRLEGQPGLPQVSAVQAAVYDAKAAVRFVVRHADEYGVDAGRIATWGTSAGAIASASMDFVPGEGASGSPGFPSNVSAHVLISGCVWPFAVGGGGGRPTPLFNVHGTADEIVFPFLAVATHEYLKALGARPSQNRLAWVPDGLHEPWRRSTRPGEAPPREALRPHISAFLAGALRLEEAPCAA